MTSKIKGSIAGSINDHYARGSFVETLKQRGSSAVKFPLVIYIYLGWK